MFRMGEERWNSFEEDGMDHLVLNNLGLLKNVNPSLMSQISALLHLKHLIPMNKSGIYYKFEGCAYRS